MNKMTEQELLHIIQSGESSKVQLGSRNLLADETEIFDSGLKDLDTRLFSEYFKKEFEMTYEEKGLTLEKALSAKKVIRNNHVTLAGLLFFGKEPQTLRPAFSIKAVMFAGNDIGGGNYRSKPEVSVIALEEVLQNALVHRDYFKNAPVRLLIFDNRIEIISPGTLPNSLTVDEVKYGNPVMRNNQIALFASRTLPYSGLGSGIRRALANQPDMELENDTAGEQFIVRFPRKTD